MGNVECGCFEGQDESLLQPQSNQTEQALKMRHGTPVPIRRTLMSSTAGIGADALNDSRRTGSGDGQDGDRLSGILMA